MHEFSLSRRGSNNALELGGPKNKCTCHHDVLSTGRSHRVDVISMRCINIGANIKWIGRVLVRRILRRRKNLVDKEEDCPLDGFSRKEGTNLFSHKGKLKRLIVDSSRIFSISGQKTERKANIDSNSNSNEDEGT